MQVAICLLGSEIGNNWQGRLSGLPALWRSRREAWLRGEFMSRPKIFWAKPGKKPWARELGWTLVLAPVWELAVRGISGTGQCTRRMKHPSARGKERANSFVEFGQSQTATRESRMVDLVKFEVSKPNIAVLDKFEEQE